MNVSKQKIINVSIIFLILLVVIIFLSLIFFNPYPLKYKKEIIKWGEEYSVSPSIIASVIYAESGFNKDAKSDNGAIGLMQILPSTAKWVCGQINIDYNNQTLFEPEKNIQIGSYYLKYLMNKFNHLNTVLASYNAGEGNVMLWLINSEYSNDKSTIKTTPFKQTNAYIEKVNSVIDIYQKKLS